MVSDKILIIDDSIVIRMSFRQMLPLGNLEILEAKDGNEGLNLIYQQQVSLIMLDWIMPRMSGWDLFQKIQLEPKFRGIPLVVMCGRREEVTEKIAEPFENFEFLEKPFNHNTLVSAIARAFAKVNLPCWLQEKELVTPGSDEPTNLNSFTSDQVVIGNQNPLTENSGVMESLAKIKLNLESPNAEQRIPAIRSALKYGPDGLDLAIHALKNESEEIKIAILEQAHNYGEEGIELLMQALRDRSEQIQQTAFWLLWDRTDPGVTEALINFLANKR